MATPPLSDALFAAAPLAVRGPADLMAAARAAPADRPLVVAAPDGTAEALGPGWPRALAETFSDAWGRTHPDHAPPPVVLVWDCGPAVGFALAALADWPAPPGWTLVLAVDADVPREAVTALAARAGAAGVTVRTTPAGHTGPDYSGRTGCGPTGSVPSTSPK
ncbi:hypothetical protein [uncultured Rhodospira sp.]|uniref:hypothetical protein n=1 Tax=uncultured Rhodospira sp. TaxID=1936189 RepID=UPI002616F9DE|nr:hypothetical protein [uncultured Rhodospira sp.]